MEPGNETKVRSFKECGKLTGQAYIVLGNRMIRLAFSMIRNQTLYRTNHENYVLVKELSKLLRSANLKHFYEIHVSSNHCQTA
jgi:transposase